MNCYYESMKCTGFCGLVDDETLPDVVLTCDRSVLADIRRYIKFAVEQADNMGFIRDGVYLYDALDRVMKEHLEMCDSPDDY